MRIATPFTPLLGVFFVLGNILVDHWTASGAEPDLPDARPVPAVQVVPMPYEQASFQHLGRELTRYHFGPSLHRPFCFPAAGPDDRSLTRMGHPHDPTGHSHHNSIWISHHNVSGVDFWGDRGKGRIDHQRILQTGDSDDGAWMLSLNAWRDDRAKTLMFERRRIHVGPSGGDGWTMVIDLQLEAPPGAPVTIGKTPFGMIGVRMAKTIGTHDGGGRILNSEGQLNEEQIFRKPARWVDYSGPITKRSTAGITLMDHPANVNHPTPFHVRGDGWMGACLTLHEPITIQPDKPLRLRYALWVHPGVAKRDRSETRWQAFSKTPLPPMARVKK